MGKNERKSFSMNFNAERNRKADFSDDDDDEYLNEFMKMIHNKKLFLHIKN